MNQNVSKTIDKIIVHISQAKTKSKREYDRVCAALQDSRVDTQVTV